MSVESLGTGVGLTRLRLVSLLDSRLQLGLATLFGLLLRFWHLTSVPPGLNQDEAVYGYDAYSIFMTGRDHLGHPFPFASLETFGDWSSPLLTYLSIPAIAVFGLHVEVLRAVSALVGLAAIPLVYLLALTMFKRRPVAVAAAWLLALSPWAVHLSRWAIIPTVVPTMVAAAMLALVWSLQTRNDRGIVAAALLAALTVAAYHSMKVYVPLLLLATAVVYWRDLLRIRLEALAYAAVVFTAIAGPILWLTLRDPGGSARLAQTSVLKDHALTPGLLLGQYAAYFSPRFWFVSGDGDPMHLPAGEGLMPLVVAPLLLAGLTWLVLTAFRGRSSELRKASTFLLLAIALYPIAGAATLPNPQVLRAVHVLPLAALVAGLGAVAIFDFVRASVPERNRNLALAVGGALAAVTLVLGGSELWRQYDNYFNRYPDQVAEKFHYGMRDALTYIGETESQYDQVWLRQQDSAYIYVLFYQRWDPSDAHNNLLVHRHAPDWNNVESLGKYHFGDPPDLQRDAVVFISRYRDGSAAYQVVSATSDGQRILILEHADSVGAPTP